MLRVYRLLLAVFAVMGMVALTTPVAYAKGHHHHNGKQLVGDKIKTNGEHVIDKKGPHTVSVNVTNGKIAGLHVKHAQKGDVPVKKYKTTKKMAQSDGLRLVSYPDMVAQTQDLGTTYIGYSYVDDYGDEQIYWFPYEMILDGDTGAVEYVPLS